MITKNNHELTFPVGSDVVLVDGKEVETYESLNALVTFDIENTGEHSIHTLARMRMLVTMFAICFFISPPELREQSELIISKKRYFSEKYIQGKDARI